jgi:hypothetical protein
LTPQEWQRGIARGKADRRAKSHERRRRQHEGSLVQVLDVKLNNIERELP